MGCNCQWPTVIQYVADSHDNQFGQDAQSCLTPRTVVELHQHLFLCPGIDSYYTIGSTQTYTGVELTQV